MGWKISPELEAKCRAMCEPTVKESLTVESSEMVEPGIAIEANRLTILIPAVTRSEANESKWVKKMARKLSAKEAVRRTLGPHHAALSRYAEAYHAGKQLRVTFTRLGGRQLDRGNLAVSMKAIEDMIEGALLASDGSPLWMSFYEQETSGPTGVRVEIEVYA